MGKYLSVNGIGKYDIEANANSDTIGSTEIWEVTFQGEDKVNLLGANGRYIRPYSNKEGKVNADAQKPNKWETFTVEDLGNGKVAFKCAEYGLYLVAGSDGSFVNKKLDNLLGEGISYMESFEIVPAKRSLKNLFGCNDNEICKVSIKSDMEKYLSVNGIGQYDFEANADKDTIGSTEIWEVTFRGEDKVNLLAANGRYLRPYPGRRMKGIVNADAQKPNRWETLTVKDLGNGKVAFICADTGNYLVAGSDGSFMNKKLAEVISYTESFEIVPAKLGMHYHELQILSHMANKKTLAPKVRIYVMTSYITSNHNICGIFWAIPERSQIQLSKRGVNFSLWT